MCEEGNRKVFLVCCHTSNCKLQPQCMISTHGNRGLTEGGRGTQKTCPEWQPHTVKKNTENKIYTTPTTRKSWIHRLEEIIGHTTHKHTHINMHTQAYTRAYI